MTALKYAKAKIAAGQFANMTIEAGLYGTFWLGDEDFKSFDGASFNSREAAEKARSKTIEMAMKAVM